MISVSKLTIALSIVVSAFTTVVVSNPIFERQTCRPNFEGNPETIYVPLGGDVVNEWTPSSISAGASIRLVQQPQSTAFVAGEFLVPTSGDAAGTYQIKLVADTERKLLLTATPSDQLQFAVSKNGSDASQVFNIDCNVCPTPGSGGKLGLRASGCTISNPATGKCVTGSNAGDVLRLSTCDGSSWQKYSFISGF